MGGGGGMEMLNRMGLARIKKNSKRNYFRLSQCGLRSLVLEKPTHLSALLKKTSIFVFLVLLIIC